MTQERAIKLMDENKLFFDVLIIDEAHKLLEYDHRNIFLSRLIKNNRRLNPLLNMLYLTPLINN
jgi:type IV secretory pathway VirB4 component